MANYGKGAKKKIDPKNKNWRVLIGAIENAKRPEALYVVMSTWLKPKLSVVKAKNNATDYPKKLIRSILGQFESQVNEMSKRLGSNFDQKFFDPSSVIFTYDIDYSIIKPGGKAHFSMEINIDTVNDIDFGGNPAPSMGDGKINDIDFKEFIKPASDAVNKILMLDVFSVKKSGVEFSRSK